jgi:hypothetical protein
MILTGTYKPSGILTLKNIKIILEENATCHLYQGSNKKCMADSWGSSFRLNVRRQHFQVCQYCLVWQDEPVSGRGQPGLIGPPAAETWPIS